MYKILIINFYILRLSPRAQSRDHLILTILKEGDLDYDQTPDI